MLPSANVLLKAAQVSIDEDKPIYLDYYQDSVDKKCCIGVQGQTKYLVKSTDEYTSTIQTVFKCENCCVDASVPVKRVLGDAEEKQ